MYMVDVHMKFVHITGVTVMVLNQCTKKKNFGTVIKFPMRESIFILDIESIL